MKILSHCRIHSEQVRRKKKENGKPYKNKVLSFIFFPSQVTGRYSHVLYSTCCNEFAKACSRHYSILLAGSSKQAMEETKKRRIRRRQTHDNVTTIITITTNDNNVDAYEGNVHFHNMMMMTAIQPHLYVASL